MGLAGNRRVGLVAALGFGVATAVCGAALAQPSPAAKAAQERHANFQKLGAAFKALNDELRKSKPDLAKVQAQTKTMAALSAALPTWFPRGSGMEARPQSEAKANIWTDAAGFSAKASAAQAEVAKLNQAAMAGDMDAVKAQVRPTGGSCKACHDVYRQAKS